MTHDQTLQQRRGDDKEPEEQRRQQTEKGACDRRNNKDPPYQITTTSPEEQERTTATYRKNLILIDYKYRIHHGEKQEKGHDATMRNRHIAYPKNRNIEVEQQTRQATQHRKMKNQWGKETQQTKK